MKLKLSSVLWKFFWEIAQEIQICYKCHVYGYIACALLQKMNKLSGCFVVLSKFIGQAL